MKNYYNYGSERANSDLKADINEMVNTCHTRSKDTGWYTDIHTGQPLQRNVGEMLCLIHSEVSEAMEGFRNRLKDDKLTHRDMMEVELADTLIRIFDLAGYMNFAPRRSSC